MAKKPKKERGIFERFPGVWYVRYRDEYGRDTWVRAGTKTSAIALRVKLVEEVRQRKLGLIPTSREEEKIRLTVASLIERYRSRFEEKKGAVAYRGYMSAWKRDLGSLLVSEVTPGDIEKWVRLQQALGKSPATINRYTSFLRSLFNLAIRDRLMESNPLAKGRLKKLPEAPPRERVLAREEEQLIFDCLAPIDQAAFVIALYSGIRQGELLRLRRSDIDFGRGILVLRSTKAGRQQRVPLNSVLVDALQFVLQLHEHDLLFPGFRDPSKPMSGVALTDRLKKAVRELGLEGEILWHTLRHTYATRLDEIGTSIGHVKDLVRHSNISVTERYMHSQLAAISEASENLARAFGGGGGFGSRGDLRVV